MNFDWISNFSLKKIHLKMSSAILQPFCSGLNMLICNLLIHVNHTGVYTYHHTLTMHQTFHFRWKPQAYWHQAICNLSKSETTVWLVSYQVTHIKLYDYHFETWGFKDTYELLNLRALKFSPMNNIHIFQCMGKIFCVEFQRYPLKLHTKYLTHTLKDMIFIQYWNFKNS